MPAITDALLRLTREQIQTLPKFHQETIPAGYMDLMGHMNIQWYMALFDQAGWRFFASFGMDRNHYEQENGGGFALQQFINYLAEVHQGETVAVHIRMLGRSARRIHFMHFMLNETTGKLACTMEVLGTHADMRQRRTSPYPPHISRQIDALLAAHQALNWEAPQCGVISA